jgi:succinyl-CoA synthetase alpha subunit
MSVLLHANTRVLIQGITGQMGRFSARDLLAYGTKVVAGVVPGRSELTVDDIPVFSSPRDAVEATGAEASLVYVPPSGILNAAIEAIEQGIRLVVATADEVPVRDVIEIRAAARLNGAAFVGPNTPGLISPGKAKMGFMPSFCFAEGPIGVISRSGSLSYEVSQRLTRAGLGQSTVLGIGGDPVKGINAPEALALFHADPDTRAVLYLGEIGGAEEVAVAEYAARHDAKPVAALIVGRSAPAGKKMGHAAALINSRADTHAAKTRMLREGSVYVADGLGDVVASMQAALAAQSIDTPAVATV